MVICAIPHTCLTFPTAGISHSVTSLRGHIASGRRNWGGGQLSPQFQVCTIDVCFPEYRRKPTGREKYFSPLLNHQLHRMIWSCLILSKAGDLLNRPSSS